MPAVHILGANQINADTAGKTYNWSDVAQQGSEAPNATPLEIIGGEGFGHVFSGGIHPESIPGVILTPLDQATDSVRGALGGLKPIYGSVVQPGPAGGAARARDLARTTWRSIVAAATGQATGASPGTASTSASVVSGDPSGEQQTAI